MRAVRPRRSVSGFLAVAVVTIAVASDAVAVDLATERYSDPAADTYLWINVGADPTGSGTFVFVADGILFWGAGGATLSDQPDGSTLATYVGPGWRNPDGTFDPFTWHLAFGPTVEPLNLSLDAHLEPEGTTSATLVAGGVTYQLDSVRIVAGADVALAEVVALLEAEDWQAVYARLQSRLQTAWSEADFVAAMSSATAANGSIDDITIVTGPVLDPPANGWDIARSEIDVTMLKDGRLATYGTQLDLVYDGSWRIARLGSIEPDAEPPASSAGPLDAEYQIALVSVPYTVTDNAVGVSDVELWWRSRPDAGAAWSAWTVGPSEAISPFSFEFASGPGLYEFYTVATDGAGNREDPPATADAATEYVTGTAPIVTERISESSQHGQGNGLSHEAYISADGRFVTFESEASDLVSGDTNAVADVFVHDRVSDTTTRVSVATDGTQANGSSEDPTISPDGRYVAYRSAASNLVAGDTNNKYDIFLHDLQTGTTTRVSLASDGTQANGSSDSAVVSRDGSAVVFRSFGRLVPGDTNGETDIYLRDLVAGTTTRVSLASDGSQADGASDGPTISDDGQIVAFDSVATNLVTGDTNGVRDVFVHEIATGTTSRVSLAADGTQGDADSWEPTLDASGATVAFTSSATTLVAGDTNAKDDVFVVTRASGAIVRASLGDDEAQSTNHADETSLSADGTLLAFYSTASNLVAGDTNGKGDVFVRDLVNGTTTRWSLTTEGLEGNDRSANPTISGDGGTVAFHSFATNLVPNDTNGVADVFVRGPDQ